MSLQNISSATICLQLVLHDVECFLLQMIIMLVKIIFCTFLSTHTNVKHYKSQTCVNELIYSLITATVIIVQLLVLQPPLDERMISSRAALCNY